VAVFTLLLVQASKSAIQVEATLPRAVSSLEDVRTISAGCDDQAKTPLLLAPEGRSVPTFILARLVLGASNERLSQTHTRHVFPPVSTRSATWKMSAEVDGGQQEAKKAIKLGFVAAS
jgi:hypothetical protein